QGGGGEEHPRCRLSAPSGADREGRSGERSRFRLRRLQRRPWGDGSGSQVVERVVHGSDQIRESHCGVERRQLLRSGVPCCSGCSTYAAADQQFGSAIARRDLERYRRKGPDASSRLLLEGVASRVQGDESLLDIGGGVGVLSFELLARGVRDATLV